MATKKSSRQKKNSINVSKYVLEHMDETADQIREGLARLGVNKTNQAIHSTRSAIKGRMKKKAASTPSKMNRHESKATLHAGSMPPEEQPIVLPPFFKEEFKLWLKSKIQDKETDLKPLKELLKTLES